MNNNVGIVTINEMFAQVEKEVSAYRENFGISTTPRLWRLQESDYRGTFVFLNLQSSKMNLTKEQATALGISLTPKTDYIKRINVVSDIRESPKSQTPALIANSEIDKVLSIAVLASGSCKKNEIIYEYVSNKYSSLSVNQFEKLLQKIGSCLANGTSGGNEAAIRNELTLKYIDSKPNIESQEVIRVAKWAFGNCNSNKVILKFYEINKNRISTGDANIILTNISSCLANGLGGGNEDAIRDYISSGQVNRIINNN